ncbi:hypothetical protein [Streptomyces litchfieldiae]|uniref:Uncharacterized protein n=1 Tax=Streptomyces litchfieldiae TaxID=3075543 RepID=A0ABU2MTB3_9ACTN|nr:hypothetical protein [Streptomyces sp. DSM 44938]MDT0344108.1 hypothetical protein [Streptomyces sp. DSM 44938]
MRGRPGFFAFPAVDGGVGEVTEALCFCEGLAVAAGAPPEAVDFALFVAQRARHATLLAEGGYLPVLRDSVDLVPAGPIRLPAEELSRATAVQLAPEQFHSAGLAGRIGDSTVGLFTGTVTPAGAAADIGAAAG